MARNSGFGVIENCRDGVPCLNQSSTILLVHLLSLTMSLSCCCGDFSCVPMTISPDRRKLVRSTSGLSIGGLARNRLVLSSISSEDSMMAVCDPLIVISCQKALLVNVMRVHRRQSSRCHSLKHQPVPVRTPIGSDALLGRPKVNYCPKHSLSDFTWLRSSITFGTQEMSPLLQ